MGCFFSFRLPPPPPLSAGAGLGDQAALLWHKARFLRFWAGFGVVPAFFVLPIPLRSVPAHGLGDRAIKLWHRSVGFSCSFLFVLLTPPSLGAGGDLGILATPTVA